MRRRSLCPPTLRCVPLLSSSVLLQLTVTRVITARKPSEDGKMPLSRDLYRSEVLTYTGSRKPRPSMPIMGAVLSGAIVSRSLLGIGRLSRILTVF